MATIVKRITKGSALTFGEYDANVENINTELVAATSKTTLHTWYHFHGCATSQIAGDGKFFDTASGNHGVRDNVDLTDAEMFANAGYVSTIDPVLGATNSVIRIPAINFDYAGGEKLIVAWWGKITPEGSDMIFLGDGYGSSTGQHGWQARVRTTGKLQISIADTVFGFSGSTTNSPFDGTLHGAAFAWDGAARKYGFWVDEVLDIIIPVDYASFHSGLAYDSMSSNTINIGSMSPSPGTTTGIATQTRCLVILRGGASDPMPSTGTVTALLQSLRTDMTKRIAMAAF